jgi:hypothetical protein
MISVVDREPHERQDRQGHQGRTAATSAARGRSAPGEIDRFLGAAKQLAPLATGQAGRLVFALDATMSRQPSWDLACSLQARMFEVAAASGGLAVQLVYFRGLIAECRSSGWLGEPQRLTGLMSRISCEGGQTQIARVLRHVRDEAKAVPIRAFVFVGDAMEEDVDALAALSGRAGPARHSRLHVPGGA